MEKITGKHVLISQSKNSTNIKTQLVYLLYPQSQWREPVYRSGTDAIPSSKPSTESLTWTYSHSPVIHPTTTSFPKESFFSNILKHYETCFNQKWCLSQFPSRATYLGLWWNRRSTSQRLDRDCVRLRCAYSRRHIGSRGWRVRRQRHRRLIRRLGCEGWNKPKAAVVHVQEICTSLHAPHSPRENSYLKKSASKHSLGSHWPNELLSETGTPSAAPTASENALTRRPHLALAASSSPYEEAWPSPQAPAPRGRPRAGGPHARCASRPDTPAASAAFGTGAGGKPGNPSIPHVLLRAPSPLGSCTGKRAG